MYFLSIPIVALSISYLCVWYRISVRESVMKIFIAQSTKKPLQCIKQHCAVTTIYELQRAAHVYTAPAGVHLHTYVNILNPDQRRLDALTCLLCFGWVASVLPLDLGGRPLFFFTGSTSSGGSCLSPVLVLSSWDVSFWVSWLSIWVSSSLPLTTVLLFAFVLSVRGRKMRWGLSPSLDEDGGAPAYHALFASFLCNCWQVVQGGMSALMLIWSKRWVSMSWYGYYNHPWHHIHWEEVKLACACLASAA